MQADTQTLVLRAKSLDAVFSRFGMMGFTDSVAVFSSLCGMLRPGGRLALVCWHAFSDSREITPRRTT